MTAKTSPIMHIKKQAKCLQSVHKNASKMSTKLMQNAHINNYKIKHMIAPKTNSPRLHQQQRRHDTQHNDIQHNDTQRNDTQHKDTRHNKTTIMPNVSHVIFCFAECHYAECYRAECRCARAFHQIIWYRTKPQIEPKALVGIRSRVILIDDFFLINFQLSSFHVLMVCTLEQFYKENLL